MRLRNTRARAGIAAALLGAALQLVPGAAASAQTPAEPIEPAAAESGSPPEPLDPVQAIEDQRRTLHEEHDQLVARAAAGATPEGAATELELIAAIERTYDAQLAAIARRTALEEARVALEERLVAGPAGSLAGPPPYSFAVLDAIADSRDAQKQRARAVRTALEAADDALEQADLALKRREEERRLARAAADEEEDLQKGARLRAAQRVAELRSRAARAERELAVLERDNLRTDTTLLEDSERLLSETVAWVRDRLDLEREPLRAPLRAIEDLQFETARNLERTERELHAAEARLKVAESRLAGSLKPPPELVAEVEARRLETQLLGRRAASLADRAKQLETNRTLWMRRRSALSSEADRGSLDAWEREIADEIEDARRNTRLVEARLLELRQEAKASSDRAAEAAARGSAVAPWEERRAHLLNELAALYEQELAAAAADGKLARRVLEDIRSRTGRTSLSERLGIAAGELEAFWNTELVAVDDQAITIGKVAGAILVFFLGLLLSVLVTRLLGRIVRRRLDEGAASAIQGLVFYVLVAITFLLALRTVNIPLTAFAILGGALAIGVGFGSQNIVNNFISGLILLAERPIKVGDLVQVGEISGHVERIGARSTRVRTPQNTHLIIPNSHFLEKEVVNWTLSDDDIRTSIDVGVMYGSPTREVDRLLRRAMTEHGKIMKNPEPDVWFNGFGDNALEFECLFWVRSRQLTERRRIASDVRFRIDNLFREAGIVIAFPQRDVHLDTVRPIEVRMVAPDENDGAPDRSTS